jgi:ABC-2 type transport system permease protein
MRSEQLSGTLEAMLVTPARASLVLFGSTSWDFIFSLLNLFVYMVLGVFVFGARISPSSIPSALVILAVTTLCFSGIGIFAASGILYFKRGDPVTFLVGGVMQLFGSVYFPATVFAGPLRRIADWIPLTYAVRAFRGTLLRGEPLAAHLSDLLALIGFSVVIIPLGILMARVAIRRARVEGTLAQY